MTSDSPRHMRLAIIAAGAAGSYCGACARDVTLARELIARGHDVQVLPLYTPLRTDGPDPSVPRVFFGGINVYLEQRWPFYRRVPGFVNWLLDRPGLLRFVSRFGIETRPEQLGDMTVSMLEGPTGRQRGELDSLIDYLRSDGPPDFVMLSNSLLMGLAPPLRDALGCAVVCNLQGEDSFVARLGDPWTGRAVAIMQHLAQGIDAFISPGVGYAEHMADVLDVPGERVHTVRTGVPLPPLPPRRDRRAPARVSFLSRLCADKGLDTLCDAFGMIADEETVLAVAGQANSSDRTFWKTCRTRLVKAGLENRLDFRGEVSERDKQSFLAAADIFCVPERVSEPRGVACLEAMAAGVPVVVPDHGIFPEIADLAGGATCVPPGDAAALAAAFKQLLRDRDALLEMGRSARAGVEEHFSAARMASRTEELLRGLL